MAGALHRALVNSGRLGRKLDSLAFWGALWALYATLVATSPLARAPGYARNHVGGVLFGDDAQLLRHSRRTASGRECFLTWLLLALGAGAIAIATRELAPVGHLFPGCSFATRQASGPCHLSLCGDQGCGLSSLFQHTGPERWLGG